MLFVYDLDDFCSAHEKARSHTGLVENWAGIFMNTNNSNTSRNFGGTIMEYVSYQFSVKIVCFGLYLPKQYDFYNYGMHNMRIIWSRATSR